jgi:hypothetical protein
LPFPVLTAKTEISFLRLRPPHEGQAGFLEPKTIASNL